MQVHCASGADIVQGILWSVINNVNIQPCYSSRLKLPKFDVSFPLWRKNAEPDPVFAGTLPQATV